MNIEEKLDQLIDDLDCPENGDWIRTKAEIIEYVTNLQEMAENDE